MLSQASVGSTFTQLAEGLHIDHDKAYAANQFLEHRQALENNLGESKLSIANRIYVQDGQQLNGRFQNVSVSQFKSGIESLNFADADESANTINQFVEEQTNGKIKNLIKSDQLDAETRTVLVNAIYFKADWEQPFSLQYTEKSDFYNNETDKVSVDFMFMDSDFNFAYVDDLDAKALQLNYANSNISFIILLPNNRTGLQALESKIQDYDLKKIEFEFERCEVLIPKFKIEYEINLNDVLKNVSIFAMMGE